MRCDRLSVLAPCGGRDQGLGEWVKVLCVEMGRKQDEE